MGSITSYPLRFEPIYQYRLWGGRRLSELLSAPLPGDGPIGEAWVLSDRDDYQSQAANGPLKGQTLGLLMEQYRITNHGRSGSAFPSLSIAAQVSRCTANALCSGASQRRASGTSATWGDEQDRSMGCDGGRKWKPHLCRTEAKYNESRAAPIARRRHNRRPLGWHRSSAGRRRVYPRRNGSYTRGRRCCF